MKTMKNNEKPKNIDWRKKYKLNEYDLSLAEELERICLIWRNGGRIWNYACKIDNIHLLLSYGKGNDDVFWAIVNQCQAHDEVQKVLVWCAKYDGSTANYLL